mgnify:CR=1 FL=1
MAHAVDAREFPVEALELDAEPGEAALAFLGDGAFYSARSARGTFLASAELRLLYERMRTQGAVEMAADDRRRDAPEAVADRAADEERDGDQGQVHGGPGALDHVERGPMGPADVLHPAVAGDVGHHLHSHALKVVPDDPDFARQVEVSQNIEAFGADAGGIAGAHQAKHGLAGGVVAGPFVALEAFGLDRQHRNPLFFGNLLTDALQVVADNPHDAGGVNEGRLGAVPVDEFMQSLIELGFAAEGAGEVLLALARVVQASAEDDLRTLLAFNPAFRLMIAHGYSDMITPYGMSRYALDHLPADTANRRQLKLYRGGHMLYIDADSRKAFSADAAAFYRGGE